jgi:hypothetical protein
VPVALGGGTLALGIAGGALAVFTSTHYSDLAETCARMAGGCPQSDRDAVAREAVATSLLLGAAAAGAIATAISITVISTGGGREAEVALGPSGGALRLRY